MDAGLSTVPIRPVGKARRRCPAGDREAFVLADELGFTEAHVGERVTDAAETIASPSSRGSPGRPGPSTSAPAR